MKFCTALPAVLARRWEVASRCCANSACPERALRLRWRDGGIRLQGMWYCSDRCFETALCRALGSAKARHQNFQPPRHRIPLGLLLLSRGELSETQLHAALEAQRTRGGGRIGKWLEVLGFATAEQVLTALGQQWACPVLPAEAIRSVSATMLPFPLLEQFRMLPVRFVEARRKLYVAFAADVNYSALRAIEEMLACHTEACLMGETHFERAMTGLREGRVASDFVFDARRTIEELARTATSYVVKLGALGARVATLAGSIWMRLEGGPEQADLFFAEQSFDRERPDRASSIKASAVRADVEGVGRSRDSAARQWL